MIQHRSDDKKLSEHFDYRRDRDIHATQHDKRKAISQPLLDKSATLFASAKPCS